MTTSNPLWQPEPISMPPLPVPSGGAPDELFAYFGQQGADPSPRPSLPQHKMPEPSISIPDTDYRSQDILVNGGVLSSVHQRPHQSEAADCAVRHQTIPIPSRLHIPNTAEYPPSSSSASNTPAIYSSAPLSSMRGKHDRPSGTGAANQEPEASCFSFCQCILM